ncbi:MAG: flagellar hook-length control protein [Mycobacterium sp.]|nr:flagellar hook-length control protein [Mycobacterium sp.]
MSIATTRKAAALAALDLAQEIHDGKVSVANLESELTDAARALVGVVVGPDDPLWPVQIDVARQVLASGGLSADEVAEWLAVLRRRAGDAQTPAETPEPYDPPDTPADPSRPAAGRTAPAIT